MGRGKPLVGNGIEDAVPRSPVVSPVRHALSASPLAIAKCLRVLQAYVRKRFAILERDRRAEDTTFTSADAEEMTAAQSALPKQFQALLRMATVASVPIL